MVKVEDVVIFNGEVLVLLSSLGYDVHVDTITS